MDKDEDKDEHNDEHEHEHDLSMSMIMNMSTSSMLQYYSMDCYFRQYWRDTRLSFQGLSSASRDLHINQVSNLDQNQDWEQEPKLLYKKSFNFSLFPAEFKREDVGENLEAGYILPQRVGQLPPHYHKAKQTLQVGSVVYLVASSRGSRFSLFCFSSC